MIEHVMNFTFLMKFAIKRYKILTILEAIHKNSSMKKLRRNKMQNVQCVSA